MAIRVGINGLGRVGRALARQLAATSDVELVAANDLLSPQRLLPLIARDSLYGPAGFPVKPAREGIVLGDRKIRLTSLPDPGAISWKEEGVDLVFEATGRFTSRSDAAHHLRGGARRVVVTATAPDADLTLFAGLNDSDVDPERDHIISAGSCTAQCLAAVLHVLLSRYGIESASMTTVHPYTTHQPLLDGGPTEGRRARAAGMSIIPTTTSAIVSVLQAFPGLEGRLSGLAIRVPTPAVSLMDLAALLQRPATTEDLRAAFREAESGSLRGLLGTAEEELVSVDFRGDPRGAVVDIPLTTSISGRLVKVVAWYDNEWGYASRLVETARAIARADDRPTASQTAAAVTRQAGGGGRDD